MAKTKKTTNTEKNSKERERSFFMVLTFFCVIIIYTIPENFLQIMLPLVVVLLPFIVYGFYEELMEKLAFRRWMHIQLGLLLLILLLSAINGSA